MRFSFALSFLTASAVQAMDPSSMKLQKEFMAAMHTKPNIKAAAKVGKIQKLQESLIKASRKLQSYGKYDAFLADQDGNIYYQGDDGLYYTANGQQVTPNGNGLYPWEYNAIPYDLASRSFKYAGCAAIKSYDTERAQENGNPMVLDNFAIFRLCPAEHCNQYSTTGCTKNYGEYAVDIKTYLMYLLSFYDEEYEGFCEYCTPCDSDVQSAAKSKIQSCHQSQSDSQFQYYSQLRQQAYQDYLAVNGQSSGNSFNWFGFGSKSSSYNNGQGLNGYGTTYYNGASNQNNPYAYYNSNTTNNGGGARHLGGNAAYASCTTFVEGMQAQYLAASQQQNGGNADYSGYNGDNNANDNGDNNANNQEAQQGNYYDEDGNYQANQNQNVDSSMYNYWMGMSCCQDGSVCDSCQLSASKTYGFCDDYVCGDYYKYCTDSYQSQQQQDVDLTDFLECTAYADANGNEYYIGPHCASDHFTISLGVFSDENCVNYVGDSVSLTSVLGYGYSDSDLFKFPETCISCDGMDDYAEYLAQGSEGRYGEYSALPDKATDTAFAMCTSLYTLSAQCNSHMNNYNQVSRLMSSDELAEETRSCTFISNIMGGSYDESGVIQLKDDTFNWNDMRNSHQYHRLRMPAGQAITLSFSIVLTIAMAAMAYTSQRAFRREGKESPWSPTAIFRNRHGMKKPVGPTQTSEPSSTTDPDGNYVVLA